MITEETFNNDFAAAMGLKVPANSNDGVKYLVTEAPFRARAVATR